MSQGKITEKQKEILEFIKETIKKKPLDRKEIRKSGI